MNNWVTSNKQKCVQKKNKKKKKKNPIKPQNPISDLLFTHQKSERQ